MGREVENLIQENSQLLETKYVFHFCPTCRHCHLHVLICPHFSLQERPERSEQRLDFEGGRTDLWEGDVSGGARGSAAGQGQAGGEEQRAGGGAKKVDLKHWDTYSRTCRHKPSNQWSLPEYDLRWRTWKTKIKMKRMWVSYMTMHVHNLPRFLQLTRTGIAATEWRADSPEEAIHPGGNGPSVDGT